LCIVPHSENDNSFDFNFITNPIYVEPSYVQNADMSLGDHIIPSQTILVQDKVVLNNLDQELKHGPIQHSGKEEINYNPIPYTPKFEIENSNLDLIEDIGDKALKENEEIILTIPDIDNINQRKNVVTNLMLQRPAMNPVDLVNITNNVKPDGIPFKTVGELFTWYLTGVATSYEFHQKLSIKQMAINTNTSLILNKKPILSGSQRSVTISTHNDLFYLEKFSYPKPKVLPNPEIKDTHYLYDMPDDGDCFARALSFAKYFEISRLSSIKKELGENDPIKCVPIKLSECLAYNPKANHVAIITSNTFKRLSLNPKINYIVIQENHCMVAMSMNIDFVPKSELYIAKYKPIGMLPCDSPFYLYLETIDLAKIIPDVKVQDVVDHMNENCFALDEDRFKTTHTSARVTLAKISSYSTKFVGSIVQGAP
jgi:hypothetical protein